MIDHDQDVQDMKQRLARIEARLSQLMLHMGLDPTVRKYSEPRKFPESTNQQEIYHVPLRRSR